MALLRGERVTLPKLPKEPQPRFPVLVTAPWCPYTVPATGFWQEAARRCGLDMPVLDAESEAGARVTDLFACGHPRARGEPTSPEGVQLRGQP